MRRDVVTLGGLESISLRFGEDVWRGLEETGSERIHLQLRVMFESSNDKVFKLILDYVHLMNRRVCARVLGDSCVLCDKIVQECETMKGRRKLSILLSRSEDFDGVFREGEFDGRVFYNIRWRLGGCQEHYELVGLLSQSITSEFVFPTSILQYSNSRMFLVLSSSEDSQRVIWSSSTFLMSNFIKYRNDGASCTGGEETRIFLVPKGEDGSVFVYSESKTRVVNKSQICTDNIKRCMVKEMIEKSIRLHRILVKYRRLLETCCGVNAKFGVEGRRWAVLDGQKGAEAAGLAGLAWRENQQKSYEDLEVVRSKVQQKKDHHDRISTYIRILESDRRELDGLIQETNVEIESNLHQAVELSKEISMYRSDLVNKVSYCIYPISIQDKSSYSGVLRIRNAMLPLISVIQNLNNKQDPEVSTSLGFSLHYLEIISNILEVPSPNKISAKGSFSTINGNPLYVYPSMNRRQISRALKFYKSVVYNILNYFNVDHQESRRVLMSNNILFMLLTIKYYIKSENH